MCAHSLKALFFSDNTPSCAEAPFPDPGSGLPDFYTQYSVQHFQSGIHIENNGMTQSYLHDKKVLHFIPDPHMKPFQSGLSHISHNILSDM